MLTTHLKNVKKYVAVGKQTIDTQNSRRQTFDWWGNFIFGPEVSSRLYYLWLGVVHVMLDFTSTMVTHQIYIVDYIVIKVLPIPVFIPQCHKDDVNYSHLNPEICTSEGDLHQGTSYLLRDTVKAFQDPEWQYQHYTGDTEQPNQAGSLGNARTSSLNLLAIAPPFYCLVPHPLQA